MKTTKLIAGTEEAWESRQLGADDANAAVASDVDEDAIDEALGLRMISIRLESSLIDDFKAIAVLNGIGYQTLMRQALKRFADGEKKMILHDLARAASKDRAIQTKKGKRAA